MAMKAGSRSKSTMSIPAAPTIMSSVCSDVLGKRFAPRLRDLNDWRLHVVEDVDAYVLLKPHRRAH